MITLVPANAIYTRTYHCCFLATKAIFHRSLSTIFGMRLDVGRTSIFLRFLLITDGLSVWKFFLISICSWSFLCHIEEIIFFIIRTVVLVRTRMLGIFLFILLLKHTYLRVKLISSHVHKKCKNKKNQ